MTGRRILDVAAIFKAARGVAIKHASLRKHQLGDYSKTSTLAKAVQSQTDRVTLTVRAVLALAECFNGPAAGYSTRASETHSASDIVAKQSTFATNDNESNLQNSREISPDHFYERSKANTAKEIPPQRGLGVKQADTKTQPLPDGSIHSSEFADSQKTDVQDSKSQSLNKSGGEARSDGYETADQVKKLQRHAEEQIPSQAAEPPRKAASSPQIAGSHNVVSSDLQAPMIQDVFYEPSSSTSEVLSALPRAKIPKNTEAIQASDEHVADDQMNQDVFYSSNTKDQERALPETQAVPEQEQIPDEAYTEIFHSPRVAKLLRGRPEKDKHPQGLDLSGVTDTPVKQTKKPSESDSVSSGLRTSELKFPAKSESPIVDGRGKEDFNALAADIAKDASKLRLDGSSLPKDVDARSEKAPFKMRQSRVPSSRFGRIWQYGGLAASMTFGAVGESLRRATGSDANVKGSLMLSAANMERLVAKLSRMRGAALKLGQMMSFQDSKMLPGPINEVLQRVQDSADYMPPSQRNTVLASNLGADWRDLFATFDEKPIAAASVGQVHSATLKSSGQRVAIKVQYPGVANSIDSDLSNLSILLTASRLLPKGLYLDKTIANARTELAWECDYIREAEMGERFRQLLKDETDIFHVPAIIKEASGPQVLTAEFCEGIAVTKVQNLTQEQKDWIGSNILRLCLREIIEFKFMQTDPNWTNFLFNAKTNKLELLDFGASREFPDKFINPYIQVLLAASRSDRETVRDLSIQLGYLTGDESQAMLKAHVGSVLTLAEPFMENAPDVYDFRDQTITDRVRGFIPVMVRERLAPPPEETYSMHRKLSGAFLLCARLGSRVRCREMFQVAMEKASIA